MADVYQAYPTPLTRKKRKEKKKKKKKKKNREGMLHVMVAEKYTVDFLLFSVVFFFFLYILPHDSGGVLRLHVGRPCVRPFVSGR